MAQVKTVYDQLDTAPRRTFVCDEHHAKVSADLIAERFDIGPIRAQKTLRATTQRCVRSTILPISRRYCADRIIGVKRLNGKFATDTAYGKCFHCVEMWDRKYIFTSVVLRLHTQFEKWTGITSGTHSRSSLTIFEFPKTSPSMVRQFRLDLRQGLWKLFGDTRLHFTCRVQRGRTRIQPNTMVSGYVEKDSARTTLRLRLFMGMRNREHLC